jgi:penicillin-binding protein 1A
VLNFFKKTLIIFSVLFFSGIGVAIGLVYYYSKDLPDYSSLQHYHPPAVTRVYSSDGKLIEEYAKEHRVFVPISTIPKSLIEAFLAAEDSKFYEHYGINVQGVFRAAFANVGRVLKGKRMEGASTITQQVVKNFFLNSEQSIGRKVKEAILAYMVTKSFTKDQILELYLNQIYLGKGAYGVAAAAQAYFNKSINELTLEESAFIAALPKAPAAFDPDKRYERILERRNYVINRMVEDRYITKAAAQEAMKLPITLKKRDKSETITADYYAEIVREKIIEIFGKEMFYTGGLTVITSMNTQYQEQAEKSLRYGIREYDMKKGYRGPVTKIDVKNWEENLKFVPRPKALLEYKLGIVLESYDEKAVIAVEDGTKTSLPLASMRWAATNLKSVKTILKPGDVIVVTNIPKKGYELRQIPSVNGAFMAMNPQTGQVLALVGGYDFNASKFNRATQALRQPGSSIKPFVYLTALENNILPNTLFEDSPISISQGPGLPAWTPKNFEGNFLGPITMRKALEKSRNLVTVRIIQHIGVAKVAELIKRFGINANPPHYPSMCLGALETTLDRMLSAYSAIANGGFKVMPQYIEMIKDSNGNTIYKRDSGVCTNCDVMQDGESSLPIVRTNENIRLSDEASIYQINSLMQGVMERGSGASARKLGKIMAGKTGTTNDSMDTWFNGLTPKLATVIYIGHDTPKDLGKRASGATVALPVFINFMEHGYKEPSLPFKKPSTIVEIKIDPATGKPSDEPGAILEDFKEGFTPGQYTTESGPTNVENDSGIY